MKYGGFDPFYQPFFQYWNKSPNILKRHQPTNYTACHFSLFSALTVSRIYSHCKSITNAWKGSSELADKLLTYYRKFVQGCLTSRPMVENYRQRASVTKSNVAMFVHFNIWKPSKSCQLYWRKIMCSFEIKFANTVTRGWSHILISVTTTKNWGGGKSDHLIDYDVSVSINLTTRRDVVRFSCCL